MAVERSEVGGKTSRHSTKRAKEPFQHAAEWQKSYITDFAQELIDQSNHRHDYHQRGWAEIDTQQDYEHGEIARKHDLHVLRRSGVNMTHPEALHLKALNEANDLKRTPEALAAELEIEVSLVHRVIEGRATLAASLDLLHAMTNKYLISLADIWLDEDDTNDGVRVMTAADTAGSSRVFERLDRHGGESPYYEYRDTAMSRSPPLSRNGSKSYGSLERRPRQPRRCLQQRTFPTSNDLLYRSGQFLLGTGRQTSLRRNEHRRFELHYAFRAP